MYSTLLLIIIYLSFISLGLPDSLLGAAWPIMYVEMKVPIANGGIIFMVISSCTVISGLLSVKIIKRFGTGTVTFVSVLMTAIALLGFSLSGNFALLCICAVPLGLGAGSVDIALNNYVATHYEARHMSWLHCFWGVGASIGPVIMSYCLSNANSWQLGYSSISFIQFSLVVILIISLPIWKNVERQEKLKVQEKQENKETKNITDLIRLPGVKCAMLSFFCYCSIEATTGLWGSSFLVIVKGIQPETAARWIALYYFGITFGRFLSGFLTIKLSNKQMVRLGQGGITLGIVLILMPFGTFTLIAGFFIIGLGCAPIFPCMIHETPKSFGSENSQAIIGIQMACACVGTALVPPFFGMLVGQTGYSILPIFLLAILTIKVFSFNHSAQ